MGRGRERPGDPPPLPVDSVRFRDEEVYRERERPEVERSMPPEPEVDSRGSRNRRDRQAESPQAYEGDAPPSKPWGFFLVLTAIVVVAAVYSVTMLSIPAISPETAVGAMSGAFALIGTLVGTYFGIKAGLDGQQKMKETLRRSRDGGGRPRERTRRDEE